MRTSVLPTRDESGTAMVVAVLVMMVAALLTVVAVALATHNLDASSLDRKRVVAVAAADAGVDAVLNALQTNNQTQLPCSVPATALASAPAPSTYTATITYYATYPPSGSPLTCTPGSGPSATPRGVQIVSIGDSAGPLHGARELQALVNLTAVPHSSFDHAIFSDKTLGMANSVTINGSVGGGNNADIYSNGDILCQNQSTVHGSLLAQGKITATNTCTTYGNWWTGGNISDANGSAISGGITSAAGSINFSNRGSAGGDVLAAGTVTCGQITIPAGHVCKANQTGLAYPPSESLPQLNWVQSAWQAQPGFTVTQTATCATAQPLVNNAQTSGGTNQAVYLTGSSWCSGVNQWLSDTTITLYHDLAIFSDNGFDAEGAFNVKSGDGKLHRIYLVVPYSAAAGGCAGHNMVTKNAVSFDANTQFFLYTPCQMTMANSGAGSGQAYAGTFTTQNAFNLVFAPALVPGDPSSTTSTFNANLVYKREMPAP